MFANDTDDEKFLVESNESIIPIAMEGAIDPEAHPSVVNKRDDYVNARSALDNFSSYSKTFFKVDSNVRALGSASL
jgi:hypothetical protein